MLTFPPTLPEDDDGDVSTHGSASALGLVVCYCREEPWRLGELLLVPLGAADATVWFGRGPSPAGEPTKSPLGQLRLGQWLPSPPLGGSAISRYQLELQALPGGRARVRNVGKCALIINDRPTDGGTLGPGDLVQVGKQLLFLCVRRDLTAPIPPADARFPFGQADGNGIVGESPAIWHLRRQITELAGRSGHVLITGPSGSGKELVAQAIHARSGRAERPLVARNAATLPETLIDAELFGNARNYPNPGMAEREGLVGDADRSTLFLDEIAELPLAAQAHLLRVLDAGEYQRLGESRARRSDFRLVAATNREVSRLKPDLLARFSFQIAVPSLDGRKEDLPLLVRHLLATTPDLQQVAGGRAEPSLEVMRRLLGRSYRTGVRELRALLWQALSGGEIDGGEETDPGPAAIEASEPPAAAAAAGALSAEQVQACLDEHNGVIELAWRALGLNNRFALLRLIKRYDIEVRRRPTRGRARPALGN